MVVLATMFCSADAGVFSAEMQAWVTFLPVATENHTAHAGQGTDAPTKNCQGAPTVAVSLPVPGCVTVSSSALGTVSGQTVKSRGLGAKLGVGASACCAPRVRARPTP